MVLRGAGVRPGMVGLVVMLVALAGCGGSPVGANPSTSGASPSSTKAVPTVDGCTVLSAQELSSLGLNSPGKQSNAGTEVGCSFNGPRYLVALAVDPARSLDGYLSNSKNFLFLQQISVNGRRGAFIQNVARDAGCSEMLALGGGVFVVTMTYKIDQKGDPCADTGHIGQVVEPKLPK